jgi:hypothetical protein
METTSVNRGYLARHFKQIFKGAIGLRSIRAATKDALPNGCDDVFWHG